MQLPKFPVTPAKSLDLRARMAALGLDEADLEETFFRPIGKRGRSGTRSGVSLLHAPTNTRIRTSKSSRQSMNRFFARRLLVEALEPIAEGGACPPVPDEKRVVEEGEHLIVTRVAGRGEDLVETRISHMHRMFARQANAFLDPAFGKKPPRGRKG